MLLLVDVHPKSQKKIESFLLLLLLLLLQMR